MNKHIGLALLIFAGCSLISGCGFSGQTPKLKRMATEYVKEKYGIKAKAGRVSNDGISWLTPIWEKSKAGIVEMKHDDRVFYVHADLDLGVDQCTDNYLEDEFCDRIMSIFQDIRCDEKNFVDLSETPWLSTASIYDWKESSMVRSEYKPVGSPYTEQFVLESYAEYNADPSRYPAYFDDYEDGKFTIKRFKQIELGNLHITCGYSDDLTVSEYSGSPESDHQGVTKWYQITNNGADVKGIVAFPFELADHDKKRVYIEKYDGEKTYVSPMGSNTDQDFISKYYSLPYYLEAGKTMFCRMVTEDK